MAILLLVLFVSVPAVYLARDRVRKADVLVPSLLIGTAGGLSNAYCLDRLGYGTYANYIIVPVIMVLVMMAGLVFPSRPDCRGSGRSGAASVAGLR